LSLNFGNFPLPKLSGPTFLRRAWGSWDGDFLSLTELTVHVIVLTQRRYEEVEEINLEFAQDVEDTHVKSIKAKVL
jgi:hypothetical protein